MSIATDSRGRPRAGRIWDALLAAEVRRMAGELKQAATATHEAGRRQRKPISRKEGTPCPV
jgi:hypothetical protein